MKRAQLMSLDLTTAGVIFILFVAALTLLLFIFQGEEDQEFQYEVVYAFDNLEANTEFYEPYEINKTAYVQFANGNPSIDEYVLGNSTTQGIGLGPAAHDACLYFTNTTGGILNVSGTTAAGSIKGSDCAERLPDNPCDTYERAMSVSKPVLFRAGNPPHNDILRMNLVVCRI